MTLKDLTELKFRVTCNCQLDIILSEESKFKVISYAKSINPKNALTEAVLTQAFEKLEDAGEISIYDEIDIMDLTAPDIVYTYLDSFTDSEGNSITLNAQKKVPDWVIKKIGLNT